MSVVENNFKIRCSENVYYEFGTVSKNYKKFNKLCVRKNSLI